jgi:hypothetical protein
MCDRWFSIRAWGVTFPDRPIFVSCHSSSVLPLNFYFDQERSSLLRGSEFPDLRSGGKRREHDWTWPRMTRTTSRFHSLTTLTWLSLVIHVLKCGPNLWSVCLSLALTWRTLILTKTEGLWITLNIDGTPIPSRSHTHPSHSQISRLLTSSLSLFQYPTQPSVCETCRSLIFNF